MYPQVGNFTTHLNLNPHWQSSALEVCTEVEKYFPSSTSGFSHHDLRKSEVDGKGGKMTTLLLTFSMTFRMCTAF